MAVWRYLVQRAVSGEWLDRDLPLTRDELSWSLSGPGALRGAVPPDVGVLRGPDGRPVLDAWGTLIYAEADGVIRWGGIVTRVAWEGAAWRVEAAGMASYPHGIPYLGEYTRTSVDPLAVVREIWSHVQSQPDGSLGMVVDSTSSPVRIGTTDEPYELVWWEVPDCGAEIDALARDTPFDYVEEHAWSGDSVSHRLRLGYPRLGRRRTDLAFSTDTNIISEVEPDRNGDSYANEVFGVGAGEGRKSVRVRIPERDGRLRRPYVVSDPGVSSAARMTSRCRAELAARRDVLTIPSVEVIDHPHAPIGSWSLGDDVLIQAQVPGLGDVAIWHRIVGWSLFSDTRALLTLSRSDSFVYGG